MSLSAHEKIEFERLTADLALDDSDLKKMAKRERATAMSYVALPSKNTILMVLVLINVCLFITGVLTSNVMLKNVTWAFGGMLAALVLVKCMLAFMTIKPATRK